MCVRAQCFTHPVVVEIQPAGHYLLEYPKEEHDIGVIVNRNLPSSNHILSKKTPKQAKMKVKGE